MYKYIKTCAKHGRTIMVGPTLQNGNCDFSNFHSISYEIKVNNLFMGQDKNTYISRLR